MTVNIPKAYFNSIIYIYPNEDDARTNNIRNGGGTGFFIGINGNLSKTHFYIVTNAHILEHLEAMGAQECTIRINTKDNKTERLTIKLQEWDRHPKNDDLAVYLVEPKESWRFDYLHESMLISEKFIKTDIFGSNNDPEVEPINIEDDGQEIRWHEVHKVGIGSDTVMVGRFIKHSGSGINYPVVRRGHIAMLPFEPMRQAGRDHDQEGFLVETYSIGGFSGSPVFVQTALNQKHKRHDSTSSETTYGEHVFLLGIDWGHFDFDGEVVATNATTLKIPSDMMCVVPSWKLTELLYSDIVAKKRLL